MNNPTADLSKLVSALNEGLTDPARNFKVRLAPDQAPRYELYHAGFSVCSQKARAILEELKVPYQSHVIVILSNKDPETGQITVAEHYRPEYVRLRLEGNKGLNKAFASGYTGRSSLDSEGFDACVVPTLVDHKKNKVIVDSKRICEYIALEEGLGHPVIPSDPAAKQLVDEQVSIVDTFPQPALLYGFHPTNDTRPEFIKKKMTGVFELKEQVLRDLLEKNADEPDLAAAYKNKIAKEAAAKSFAKDVDFQLSVRAETQSGLQRLEEQLAMSRSKWICGDDFSLGDIVWGINLYRLHWLGLAPMWNSLGNVKRYAQDLYAHPTIRTSVITFPDGMPESPYVSDIK